MVLLSSWLCLALSLGCQANGGGGGEGSEGSDQPSINAGDDLTVAPGTRVTLSALPKDSTEASSTSFQWSQVFGTSVELAYPNSYSVTFTAPVPPRDEALTLIFEVMAIAQDGSEVADSIKVIVSPDATDTDPILYSVVDGDGEEENEDPETLPDEDDEIDPAGNEEDEPELESPPVALAGADMAAEAQSLVILDGSASYDPDGDALACAWFQTAGPAVIVADATKMKAYLVAPDVEDDTVLTFSLTVSDGKFSVSDTVTVVIATQAESSSFGPVANAGPALIVVEGQQVTLDGSASETMETGTEQFAWSQSSGASVALSNADTPIATFIAPTVESVGAILTFELSVMETGLLDLDSVQVAVLDDGLQNGDDPIDDELAEEPEEEEEEEEPYVPPVPPGTNVALNRGSSYTAAPNYSTTTGVSDPVDLTDGAIYGGSSKLWTLQSAVGWSYVFDPVGIHIDLGDIYPIESLTFDSAAGASGVYMPGAVLAYVSDDGINWHYVTNLMTEPVSQVVYDQHKYVKSGLKTAGRFIAFYAMATGPFIFCDEIEVLSGDFDPADVDIHVPILTIDQLASDTSERYPFAAETTSTIYLIDAARDAIAAVTGGNDDVALAALDSIEIDALLRTVPFGVNRQDGLPYTPLEEEVCVAVGEYMESAGQSPLLAWEYTSLDKRMLPFDRPSSSAPVQLYVDMMVNEHEHASFSLSNNTADSLTVQLSSNAFGSMPSIKYREAFYVLAPGYQFIGDALPDLIGGSLVIPPGMTKEVWVDLDAKNVAPGTYAVDIVALSGTYWQGVDLAITVYDPVMPDDPEYITTVWTYFGNDVISEYQDAAAADQVEHYVNLHTLNTAEIPTPWVTSGGDPILPVVLDFTQFDKVISLRPARFYVLLVTATETNLAILLEGETGDYREAFDQWVVLMRDHMTSLGIPTDQWAFFWVDEPTLDEWTDYIKPLCEWTKEVDPAIQIYQIWNKSEVETEIFANPDLIDIHVPSTTRMDKNSVAILDFMDEHSTQSWKYDSTSSLARLPYTDYRLSHWSAWNYGLKGNGKWVYLDSTFDVWNDYGAFILSLVYPGNDKPIPSKRYEAWRDGIEDYELMNQLAAKVAETGDPILTALLEDTPGAVLGDNDNPDILEPLRLSILQGLSD